MIFTDIRMPGLSGLELAVRLKSVSPNSRIIFVTGYEEYTLQAFRLHASGYLLKPVDATQVREELDALSRPLAVPKPDKPQVRCFGYFEVFWQGAPLHFERQQTKELLAYLVSRSGTACTNEQIAAALWENEGDTMVLSNRIRVLLGNSIMLMLGQLMRS